MITAVSDGDGHGLHYQVVGERLDVGVPAGEVDPVIEVSYTYSAHNGFDGAMDSGLTFLWPYHCGNLFPCHSDPAEGTTFELSLQGVSGDDLAVYPASIPSAVPAYQIGWAFGDYTQEELGTTAAGTQIRVWYLPGSEAGALSGTADLVAVFEWFETTLGPYPFGAVAGSVEAAWGPGAYGGMEHHPFWHVSSLAMDDPTVHAHEAAHGWYGGGVRIACWEDFVLSEGTASYLTARATGAVLGAEAEQDLWAEYESKLQWALANQDTIAWPKGCGDVDVLTDGLYSLIPYMKGAFFYEAVADEVGAGTLDGVLSSFVSTYSGFPAGMADMLDHIQAETGFDPGDLADAWLRSMGAPGY